MGRGREVADAYVDVHGDISKFRKDLEKGKGKISKVGEDYAKEFGDAFEKRGEKDFPEKMSKLFRALQTKSKFDWNKLFGTFDDTNLRSGVGKTLDFLGELQNEGQITAREFWGMAQQVDKAFKKIERSAHRSAIAKEFFNKTFGEFPNFKTVLSNASTAFKDLGNNVRHSFRDYSLFDRMRAKISGLGGTMSKVGTTIKNAWKGIDDDVRMVLMLIAAGAGPISAGLSGIAAAGTAVASSLAYSLASAVPLATAMSGLAIGIGLAVSSMESMKKQFPGIQTGMNKISSAWKTQAKNFGAQWGSSLSTLLNNFGTKLASVDFGTPFGKAFAGITNSFNGVVNGPGFRAFLTALTNDIPAAVQGFGSGFAGVMGAVTNLLAGAAPVAKALGKDFEAWGKSLNAAAEAGRKSGAMNEVFEKARESLKAVLGLAGSLGGAMGTLFTAGADSGNKLITSLTGIINKWNTWMKSASGQNWLKQWFADGEKIISSFGPLLKGVAGFFDNLVTPYAISQFTSLMEKLGAFLPVLGEILSVVSNLGIFNILVDAMIGLGSAVQPMLPALSQLAVVIGTGLSGAMRALAPLFSTIGTAMAPIVQTFADIAARVIPQVVQAFGRISTALQPVIEVIGQVVGAIVDFLAPILGDFLIGIINAAVGFIEGISRAFMGVVNVVKGIFSGDWTMVWEGIKMIVSGAVEAIWNFIQLSLVGKAFGAIKGFLTGAKGIFTSIWNSISSSTSAVFTNIGNFIRTILGGIGNFIKTALGGIKSAWTSIWSGIKSVTSTVWNGIKSFISTVFNGIKSFIKTVLGNIKNNWTSVWNGIKTLATIVWNGIKAVITNVLNGIKAFIVKVLNATKATWSSIWNSIKATASNIWNAIKSVIKNAINAVKNTVSNVMNSIKSTMSNTMNSAKSVVSNVWNRIKSIFSNAVNAAKNTVSNGFKALVNSVKNGVNNAVNFVKSLPGKIKSALGNLGGLLVGAGKAILNGFKRGLQNAWGGVKNFVGGIGSWIKNNKGPIEYDRKLLIPAGNAIMQGLGKGLEAMIPALKGKLDVITGSIVAGFSAKDVELKRAADGMSSIIVGSLGANKMVVAGKDAANGFAAGLAANSTAVKVALAKLTPPKIDSSLVIRKPVEPRAVVESDPRFGGGSSGTVIEAGAIQVNTPASDGKIVASQLLDELARKGA